jgi:cyclic beta-1,2-glucan synthetase
LVPLSRLVARAWPRFAIAFRYHLSRYEIVVKNPHGVARGVSSVTLDGAPLASGAHIPLADDSATHHVRVVLGAETLRAPSCVSLLRA